jgi:hypothetical protein
MCGEHNVFWKVCRFKPKSVIHPDRRIMSGFLATDAEVRVRLPTLHTFTEKQWA